MKYRLVAVDMDGTLLNPEKKITEHTVQAVKQVQEQGVMFTIATGRPIQGVSHFCHQLGLTGPIITYNGAEIIRGDTGEVLYRECVCPEDARHAFALGREYEVVICVWAGGHLYVSEINDRSLKYASVSGETPIRFDEEHEEGVIEAGITKILWYDTEERIAEIEEELQCLEEQQECFEQLTYCTSEPIYLEMFSSKVSKAKAMEQIGRIYGIRREEMIAIGDGMNDMQMIRYAGLGVAMENAVEELKEAAGYVTKSNADDGVAYVLEHIAEMP